FVDDDAAQILDRRKDRGARSDDDIREPSPNPAPLVKSLARSQSAMQHREATRKTAGKPLNCLGSEGDFWHQHDCTLASIEELGDQSEIDLGLATSGYP